VILSHAPPCSCKSKEKEKEKKRNINNNLAVLPSHDIMDALILERVQKCKVRQITKNVVKSEV